jgi:hypothetical protein
MAIADYWHINWNELMYKGVEYSYLVEQAKYGRTGYFFSKVFQVSVTLSHVPRNEKKLIGNNDSRIYNVYHPKYISITPTRSMKPSKYTLTPSPQHTTLTTPPDPQTQS